MFRKPAIGVLVGSAALASAQVTFVWDRAYNGPGNYHDRPRDMILDRYGQIYVTGSSYPAGTQNDSDYLTIKYNPAGGIVFTRRDSLLDYDSPSKMAIDALGRLYVTGITLTSMILADGSATSVPAPGSGAAADNAGNVYVVGSLGGDVWIRKYNGLSLVWERFYDGPQGLGDVGIDCVCDSQGNVFIAGRANSAHGNTSDDLLLLMYDPAGTRLWARTVDGTESKSDLGLRVVLDRLERPVVMGWSNVDQSFYGGDILTVALDRQGTERWRRTYASPNNAPDRPFSMAADNQGNIVIAGWTERPMTGQDYLAVSYDNAGVMRWEKTFDGFAGFDQAYDAAMDSEGNSYVAGGSTLLQGGSTDFLVIKYSPSGQLLWLASRDRGSLDNALKVAVDEDFNVVVAGESYGQTSETDYWTVYYRQDNLVLPHSFVLNRGLVISGALEDLFTSDEGRLAMRPGIVFSTSEAPVQLVIEGMGPRANPIQLRFKVESRTTVPNIRQTVELFNWTSSSFEQADSVLLSQTDGVRRVVVTQDISRFLEPQTGRLRARLSYKAAGPVFSYPWQAQVDQAVWYWRPE